MGFSLIFFFATSGDNNNNSATTVNSYLNKSAVLRKNIVLVTFLCSFIATVYVIYIHFFYTQTTELYFILGSDSSQFPDLLDPFMFTFDYDFGSSMDLSTVDAILIILEKRRATVLLKKEGSSGHLLISYSTIFLSATLLY